MKNKLNHNEATVVEDYHNKTWKDKTVRPTMIEVHLCVSWYTVDEQPSWHPSFNVRKSKVRDNTYKGVTNTMYETVGSAPKLEELWYDNIWLKYTGEKMPRFDNSPIGTNICRTDTIYDYPGDLIEVLRKYKDDPRTKEFVCGTGKFWVESPNSMLSRGEKAKVDPNPDKEEISKMTLLFETEAEAKEWINSVMAEVKGFSKEQIQKNKDQKIEKVYSDEEEEQSPVLVKLEELLKVVAKHADHFCKPENKRQLQWIMWRYANIFYSARSAKVGYDDSLKYFFDSFEWSDGLTETQVNAIMYASSAEHKLSNFGYIHKEFSRGSYICDVAKLNELETSEPSEATLLAAKNPKTFDEHVKMHHLIYGENDALSIDLFLTYYGGYNFVDGYLVEEQDIDPMFVYGSKEMPEAILNELNEILLDKIILDVQNYGREEWEKDMVFSYESRFMSRKDIPDELKDKMKKFNMSQWIHFIELLMKSADKIIKKPYKLILGIDPMIKKVTKDSHPSYVKAAINICEKTLDSSASTDKDKSFAKSILKKLQ